MSLKREGQGDTIVFLHGYLSRKESFYYQTEFFKRYYTVISFDFLGFGNSSPLARPFSVGDYAGWTYGLLKAQHALGSHIVAHSFGGRVALKLVCAHPDAAKSLVITGGAGIVWPRSAEYIKKVRTYRLVNRFFPGFAQRHFGSVEYRGLTPVMRESYKKIVNEDLRGSAAAVKCPTLLLYGKEDATTPPDKEGAAFAKLINGSVFKTMAGGHFCFCEHPAEFNKQVLDFLREI